MKLIIVALLVLLLVVGALLLAERMGLLKRDGEGLARIPDERWPLKSKKPLS